MQLVTPLIPVQAGIQMLRSEASVLGSPLSRGRARTLNGQAILNPKLAAALAALVDAEKKLLQCRPLPDQTLLV